MGTQSKTYAGIEERNELIRRAFNKMHFEEGFTVNETLERLSEIGWQDQSGIRYIGPDGIRNVIYNGGYYRKKAQRNSL